MSLSEYAPETPDILSPTNWKTAVLAVPLGAVFGIAMGIVVQGWIPAWPATAVCAIGLMWYLSQRETLSDLIGTAALTMAVPAILFPAQVFASDYLGTEATISSLFVFLVLAGGAVLVAVVLVIVAVLAFRH
jgi:hypothetical protein